jgi:hypothetical protein
VAAIQGAKSGPGVNPASGPMPTTVEIHAGVSLVQSSNLPELSAADRSVVASAVSSFAATLHEPCPPEVPGDPSFPPGELAGLAANPSNLDVRYGRGNSVAPLASSGAVGAHLLCPIPIGRTTAGDLKILPFVPPNAVPAPLLVTYAGGKPVFSKIPPTQGDCFHIVLVDGAKPTVVVDEVNGTQHRLRWLRNGNWIDAGPRPGAGMIAMGSALPDGSLLLLTKAATAPNYALVRLPVTGGLQNACAACASMPLMNAVQALMSRFQDNPLGQPNLDPTGTILVDRAGHLLARPDGEETVIESLQTGAEILRVKLSSPLVLRNDIVILDTGESKLQVHQLAQH